jgi:hypothetical protein
MKKIIFKIGILLLSIFLILILYLSIFGIKTDKFNHQIQTQLKKIDNNIEAEIKNINIILDPLSFRFNLKTLGTNLIYKNKKIKLERIETGIYLKSILSNKLLLKELKISTKAIKLKNLISLLRVVNNDPKLFIAEQFVKKGYVIADINFEFGEDGKIKDNFNVIGFVKNGSVNLLRKNTLSKMSFNFKLKKDEIEISDFSLLLNNKNFLIPEIKSQKIKKNFVISGVVKNKKITLEDNDLEKIIDSKSFDVKFDKVVFASENQFSFQLDKKFNLDKFVLKSSISLDELILENRLALKKIFPKFKDKINLRDHKINLEYKKDFFSLEGAGKFFIKENDKINYKITKKGKSIDFSTVLEVSNNQLKLDILNFQKKDKTNLKINIIGKQDSNKDITFKEISLEENNNYINIKKLLLKKFDKIQSVEKIDLDYIDKENLPNKISISRKEKNYLLKGQVFNANKLIENLLKSKSKNRDLFTENFKIDIDIKKFNLDKNSIITDLNGFLILENNKILKANLESTFLNQKKIKFTIRNNNGEKITTFFSGEAKPLIDRYKFIKGFEEGSLDFNSVSKNNISNSTLKIYDFKLKELPALTKILTLASLQGIADILSGEGIRFKEFEMNFSNKDQLMTIDEIYAIGPALSILIDGYVETDKLVSLRGTLIPATTLNKVIGSIPFLGDVLVGKKTGEGVFGVSFKIKGPPKNLETSVNPIKTLTPRFITRTLEKIKKN